ncbi:MAG: DnaJ domain-containing protein [Paludibacteraceae bacterium]|nr:DnaJ domain-containing protein [Paludibacteraceae bacterium]
MNSVNTFIVIAFCLFFGVLVYLFFRMRNRSFGKSEEGRIAVNIIALFSMVIRMNDRVDKEEIDLARKYFFLHFPGHYTWALRVLDELNKRSIKDYRTYCLNILQTSGMKYAQRFELLNVLFEIGYTYNGIDEKKLELLRNIAKFLRIQDWDLASLEYRYECGHHKDRAHQEEAIDSAYKFKMTVAYTILGLKYGSSVKEVKTAYREMAMKYHPDHLPAGLDAEMVDMSSALFRQINEAYQYLMDELKNE